MRQYKRIVCALAVTLVLLGGCARGPENTVSSREDLAGKTVGVLADSAAESYLEDEAEIYARVFSDADDMARELLSGGLDAAAVEEGKAGALLRHRGLVALDEPLYDGEYRIALSQENTTLLKNVNQVLRDLRRDGTLRRLKESWLEGESLEPEESLHQSTMVIAVSPEFYPYAFYDEAGELAGLEIDLARLICERLEVSPEFRVVEENKVLYMAESGKASLAIGRLAMTEAPVSFTEPYAESVQKIIVRK